MEKTIEVKPKFAVIFREAGISNSVGMGNISYGEFEDERSFRKFCLNYGKSGHILAAYKIQSVAKVEVFDALKINWKK